MARRGMIAGWKGCVQRDGIDGYSLKKVPIAQWQGSGEAARWGCSEAHGSGSITSRNRTDWQDCSARICSTGRSGVHSRSAVPEAGLPNRKNV